MNLKKLVCSTALGALSLVAVPDDAFAASGYVCEVFFSHYKFYGNHGYVYVSTTTQPNCAGNWIVGAVFCTTGASDVNCSPGDLNTSPEILALVQNLQRAAADRQRVSIVASGGAGQFVYFHGM